jgi:hypothetical protein
MSNNEEIENEIISDEEELSRNKYKYNKYLDLEIIGLGL